MIYLYLHGFASGPESLKAQSLRSQFQAQGQTLIIPDLNQPDFSHLTLTRQIQQVSALITSEAVLIGSSLGGLTAAWLAQQPLLEGRIQQLILLAPAFNFLDQWLPRLGPEALSQWRDQGWLPVYHYRHQRELPLHYAFVTDAQHYLDRDLQAAIPTLILHGRQDQVIPLTASQAYAQNRPWVTLQALNTDHGMADALPEISHAIAQTISR